MHAKALSAGRETVVIRRHINDLKLDPRNPRLHSKRQIRQIAVSIAAFGFNVPVLTDKHDRVIAGHGRILASKELGLVEVPTICLEHLSGAQAKAFMIADNHLTEIATWNEQLLAEQLQELSLAELDFDIEATGFHMGEIDFRIQALDGVTAEPDPDDELPPDSGPPVTKSGDLWELGRHRIYCGNALEEASLATLINGKRASMAFTDPPYNVRIQGNVSGLGKVKHGEFLMASGEMSEEKFTAFLTKAFNNMTAYSRAGAIHFACADWRHLSEYLAAGKAAFSELKNLCVWTKDNAGMGSMYRSQHELVFVFKSGSGSHRNNVQLGQFGRHRSNVWRYPGVNSFARSTDEGNLLALHPTVKPVAMVADAILDCSARGDVVLDPFLGSGTTLIAAERTGRAAFGVELEPRYVDVAVRRWEALTGDQAKHASSGRSFGQHGMRPKKRGMHHD
jgi:DNA modification methylase